MAAFWKPLFRSDRYKSDLDAEIQSHLAMAAADKQALGADAETARQLARREFGNIGLVKEVTSELSGWMWLERLDQDLRLARRQIYRTPGFSLAVILTLALGIGVNTAVFSMVNGVMLRPLPYPDADRVASLILHGEGISGNGESGVDDDDSHNGETWSVVKPRPYRRTIRCARRNYRSKPDAPLSTEPVFYLPAAQADPHLVAIGNLWFQPSWIVRTRGPMQSLTSAMQHALAEADPTLPFAGFYAMSDILAQSLVYRRIEVALLTGLAGLALLLSAIGIYSLVSSLVVQRTREIGIRIALGSSISDAMIRIGASGVIATAFGLVAEVGLSLLATQIFAQPTLRSAAHDPITPVAVPVILAVIALAASFLPTLRITRIQPAETLRVE